MKKNNVWKKITTLMIVACMTLGTVSSPVLAASETNISEEKILTNQQKSATVVEITKYCGDSSVSKIAKAIPGMKVKKSTTYKSYCSRTGLSIGILKDKKKPGSTSEIDSYRQLTDVSNTGYKGVTFAGVKIGDTYASAKAKLNKNAYITHGKKYVFWCGNASTLTLKFRNGKLVSYRWKLRHTS